MAKSAASAVVIGTAVIKPSEPTSVATTSCAMLSVLSALPKDISATLNSSTVGSAAPT